MKCFYHEDLDGRMAMNIVAQYEENYNEEDYFEVDYVQPIPFDIIQPDELVYFVDYSFSLSTKDRLVKLLEITKNIVWIDHHESSIRLEKEYPEFKEIPGIRENGKISGAGLTWMYLHRDKDLSRAPEEVRLTSDYDCWILSNKKAMLFKLGMDSVPHTNVSDTIWINFEYEPVLTMSRIIDAGLTVQKYITEQNKIYVNKYGFETTINGYKTLACNKKDNSLLFGELIKEYDLVCPFVYDGTGYTYSLFTDKDDIDCGKIAETFGGGGREQCAGFHTKELIFNTNI